MAAFLNRPEMLSYENPARDFQGITSLRHIAVPASFF